MGGGLELGFVSVDIIVSCQRCSYSSGGVVTNTNFQQLHRCLDHFKCLATQSYISAGTPYAYL